MKQNKIDQAIEDIKLGVPVIVVDDFDRENEGDIIIAVEKITKDNLLFLMQKAGGLMCIAAGGEIIDKLELPMMVTNSTDKNGTPFTVSIDAAEGTTTGMSIDDRLKTLSVFINDNSKPEDLSRPGHLFPLRAKDGLLKERRGHTESGALLAILAGLKPAAVIVEMMNTDGTMKKGQQIMDFAKENNLLVISVEELYNYTYND
jgi:3,4-dihydroxy 2-butanone 4-phosphate synthase / GTP cyclohydrolase II